MTRVGFSPDKSLWGILRGAEPFQDYSASRVCFQDHFFPGFETESFSNIFWNSDLKLVRDFGTSQPQHSGVKMLGAIDRLVVRGYMKELGFRAA